jgi:hypothetical protein
MNVRCMQNVSTIQKINPPAQIEHVSSSNTSGANVIIFQRVALAIA